MTHWQPLASQLALKARAGLLAETRHFFAERKVLEVDTPLICPTSVTDPHIESLQLTTGDYLQTSPEYQMKRLLAAGIGDCYQICKAFREDEKGIRHNPEFTLLEWYRVDFDLWALMEEVADFIETVTGYKQVDYLSYQDAFLQFTGIDPLTIDKPSLIKAANKLIDIVLPDGSKDDWLHALMGLVIEPELGKQHPVFIYDYPPSQAALAKIATNERGQSVASRFELYMQGIELANGFHELTDSHTQRARFIEDNMQRKACGQKTLPIDEPFIAALDAGLPDCSGVALGLDRLLMVKLKQTNIDSVLSFR